MTRTAQELDARVRDIQIVHGSVTELDPGAAARVADLERRVAEGMAAAGLADRRAAAAAGGASAEEAAKFPAPEAGATVEKEAAELVDDALECAAYEAYNDRGHLVHWPGVCGTVRGDKLLLAAFRGAGVELDRFDEAPPALRLNAAARFGAAGQLPALPEPRPAADGARPFAWIGRWGAELVLPYAPRHRALPTAWPLAGVAARLRELAARGGVPQGDGNWPDDPDEGGPPDAEGLAALAAAVEALPVGGLVRTDDYRGCGQHVVVAPFAARPDDRVLVSVLGEYGDTLPPEVSDHDGVEWERAVEYIEVRLVDPLRVRAGTAAARAVRESEANIREAGGKYESTLTHDYGSQEVDLATFPRGYAACVSGGDPRRGGAGGAGRVSWIKLESLTGECVKALLYHAAVYDAEAEAAERERLHPQRAAAVADGARLPAVLGNLAAEYVPSLDMREHARPQGGGHRAEPWAAPLKVFAEA